tara:strand:- start:406 stop:624 length:219 start_codon:yes stop_codon:yes gene_type:complete
MGNKQYKSFKSNGTQYHTFDNKFHSWDGPAIIHENGDCEYYVYGNKKTKAEFQNMLNDMKLNNNATAIPKNI